MKPLRMIGIFSALLGLWCWPGPTGFPESSSGRDDETLEAIKTEYQYAAESRLWSEFPTATATEVKFAATQAYAPRRTTVVPPLLDAWAAYQVMRR